MRLTLLYSILLVITLNTALSQTFFKEIDLVDEFGDKIGEVKRNVSMGTFSNTATSDSKLRVHTILEEPANYNLDEYKEYLANLYSDTGYSEKIINRVLKKSEKMYDDYKNLNGTISFNLYEYNDNVVSSNVKKKGYLSIKTSDGRKITTSFSGSLKGYKEQNKTLQLLMKNGYYDWTENEIYNEIINATGQIQIVLSYGSTIYKFSLDQDTK
ncbi:hypothetical protein [Maribacter aquivivus]|uniref:hypothetical protein n=1 Tax=Maribacter aquivivus TaxID=228958 RepID=UPI002494C1FE|nr:hypothetical protein [Maribacter aquivivus]